MLIFHHLKRYIMFREEERKPLHRLRAPTHILCKEKAAEEEGPPRKKQSILGVPLLMEGDRKRVGDSEGL